MTSKKLLLTVLLALAPAVGAFGQRIAATGINRQISFTSARSEANVGARICGAYDDASFPAYGGTIWADEFTGGQVPSDCFSARTGKQVELILGNGSYTFAASTTIPANWQVRTLQGAQFCPASGTSLTVNKLVADELQTVLCPAALGIANFSVNSGHISSAWWGAVPSQNPAANIDSYAAMQAMLTQACTDAAAFKHYYILFPGGWYWLSKIPHLSCGSTTLISPGSNPFFQPAVFRRLGTYGMGLVVGVTNPTTLPLTAGPFAGTQGLSINHTTGPALNYSDAAWVLNTPNFLNGLAAVTSRGWVKATSIPNPSDGEIFVESNGSIGSIGNLAHRMRLEGGNLGFPAGSITCQWNIAGTVKTINSGANLLSAGVWTNLECVFDNASGKIYLFINGASAATPVAAAGAVQQKVYEDISVGLPMDIFPESQALVAGMDGVIAGWEISNVARHTAAFTNPSALYTADGNTLAYSPLDTANTYDIFTDIQTKNGTYETFMRAPALAQKFGVTVEGLAFESGPLVTISTPFGLYRNNRATFHLLRQDNFGSHIDHESILFTTLGCRYSFALEGGGMGDLQFDTPNMDPCAFNIVANADLNINIDRAIFSMGSTNHFAIAALAANSGDGIICNNCSFSMENGTAPATLETTFFTSGFNEVIFNGGRFESFDTGGKGYPLGWVEGGGAVRLDTITSNIGSAPAPSSLIHVIGSGPNMPIQVVGWRDDNAINLPLTDVAGTGLGFANATQNCTNTVAALNKDGSMCLGSKTFATLPAAPQNGQILYCSDCAVANPCAAAGAGALAKRINGAWVCN